MACSGPVSQPNESMKLIIAVSIGVVLGYFIGISLPAVNITKVHTLSIYSEWLTLFISKTRPENSICLTRQLHLPRSNIVCTEEDGPSLDTSTSGHVHSSNNRRLHANNSLSHNSNNTRLHSNNNLKVLLYFYVKLTARSIMRSFMEPFSCCRIQLFFLSCFMYDSCTYDSH